MLATCSLQKELVAFRWPVAHVHAHAHAPAFSTYAHAQASIDYLGDLAEAGSKDCGGNGGPAGGGGSGGSGPKKGGNKVFA